MALVHPDDSEVKDRRERRNQRIARSLLEIPAAPILKNYGITHQIRKTVEELDELLEEIRLGAKWWRDGTAKLTERRREAILTECVDVTVTCAQLIRLYQVVWPSNSRKVSAMMVIRTREQAQILKKEIAKQGPKPVEAPTAFFMMMQAIRLGVAISDRDAFQAEVNFKIERQLGRIQDERNQRSRMA